MRRSILIALALAMPVTAVAQQSTSYRLAEHVLNGGGHPTAGVVAGSTTFRLTLGAIGEAVAAASSSSGSYRLEGGFTAAHPPPGEVANLRFATKTTLQWDAHASAVAYNLYRGTVAPPFDGGYGSCLSSGLGSPTAAMTDTPASGQAWFLLVTAVNLLGEEGAKGNDSSGILRPNPAPCP